jgi:hypothetical protein
MESYCKVSECRFSDTHTTIGHKCGRCGSFGHGVLECRIRQSKINLQKYVQDILPEHLWCTICQSTDNKRKSHTNCAHTCLKCRNRHSEEDCIIQPIQVFRDRFIDQIDLINFSEEKMQNYHDDNIYTKVYVGMGCQIFIRKKDGEILSLFMHSDAWGQYGPNSDDRPTMGGFIQECIEVDKDEFMNIIPPKKLFVSCPICRASNNVDNIKQAYGMEEKCKICLEESVTKFFGECGHAVCCGKCYEGLN